MAPRRTQLTLASRTLATQPRATRVSQLGGCIFRPTFVYSSMPGLNCRMVSLTSANTYLVPCTRWRCIDSDCLRLPRLATKQSAGSCAPSGKCGRRCLYPTSMCAPLSLHGITVRNRLVAAVPPPAGGICPLPMGDEQHDAYPAGAPRRPAVISAAP